MLHVDSWRGRRGSILHHTLIHHHGVAGQDDFVVRIIDHQVAAPDLDRDVAALGAVTARHGGHHRRAGAGAAADEAVGGPGLL